MGINSGFKGLIPGLKINSIGRMFSDIYNLTEQLAIHGKMTCRITLHRPGDDPCKECDRCACARFHDECRVDSIYPAYFLTVHPLAARYSKCLTFVDLQLDAQNSYLFTYNTFINTLWTGDADLRF